MAAFFKMYQYWPGGFLLFVVLLYVQELRKAGSEKAKFRN